jgi:hypothetical protein
MPERLAAILCGILLMLVPVVSAAALAGPAAPKTGHYANHALGKLPKNALDFDVVHGKVTAISHFDKCVRLPLRWPVKIPFRKGVFSFKGTVKDVLGGKFAVTFNGTAVSKTRVNGVLLIKVTKSSSTFVKNGCRFSLTYKAKRVGPPAGIV